MVPAGRESAERTWIVETLDEPPTHLENERRGAQVAYSAPNVYSILTVELIANGLVRPAWLAYVLPADVVEML